MKSFISVFAFLGIQVIPFFLFGYLFISNTGGKSMGFLILTVIFFISFINGISNVMKSIKGDHEELETK
jgi:hypothetical protein